MGHLNHGEEKAGRNDASASGSLLAQKIFSCEISFENAPRREVGGTVVQPTRTGVVFLCPCGRRAQYLAGLSMKDTTENTDQIEEAEDISTADNATPDEAPAEVPARVRLSPIGYDIVKAGSKAYTLLIDKQPVATTVTRKDAETLEALFRFMTKYSGRRYLREALETVLTEPDTTEAESAEEPQVDPMNN